VKVDAASGVRLDSGLRRAVDVVVAGGALLVLLPVLVVVALAVLVDSPGPAVYAQERVGRERAPFRIHKFRTMVADADRVGPAVGGRRDPRITRVGRVLRRTKLDELPQLWDVLVGRMALVGPRAEVARYVAHFTADELATLLVRPGLTGAGQLWFTVAQADDLDGVEDPERVYVEEQLHPKLARDLVYLRRRGLRADLRLVVETLAALVGRPLADSWAPAFVAVESAPPVPAQPAGLEDDVVIDLRDSAWTDRRDGGHDGARGAPLESPRTAAES
jgi:lipopolysaccharide/colanic/teichoic acid biosynthesis glycosyltransferase